MNLASRNQNETLTQNYRRLGLASRLNSATGGTEKLRPGEVSHSSTTAKLAIANAVPKQLAPSEARVERDPATGKIVRVIHEEEGRNPNPLNDPLNDIEAAAEKERAEGGSKGTGTEIVRKLEEQAAMVGERRERSQSEREREWIGRLVEAYGDDYVKMARDRKLNPMQQTPNDLRRRIGKWRSKNGGNAVKV